ncbi:MAG: hypothetical protein ABIA74_00590 [bacterium]
MNSTTIFVFDDQKESALQSKFIDNLYERIKESDDVDQLFCSGFLDKISSVEQLFRACKLALKILASAANQKDIKFICFRRTFNPVFLASLLLDEGSDDVLAKCSDNKIYDFSKDTLMFLPNSAYQESAAEKIEKLKTNFKKMFEKIDFQEKEIKLNKVLQLKDFNELFKVCHDKIMTMKRYLNFKNKYLISSIVILDAPSDKVMVSVEGEAQEVKTNNFYFKPSEKIIHKIRNIYSLGLGRAFIGNNFLPFDDLHENFLNVVIGNNDIMGIMNLILDRLDLKNLKLKKIFSKN